MHCPYSRAAPCSLRFQPGLHTAYDSLRQHCKIFSCDFLISGQSGLQFAIAETDVETIPKINATGMKILTYNQAYSKQQMKELVRDTRTAIANNFLGSLESFLVYYDCLMQFCHQMLSDTTAMDAMRVSGPVYFLARWSPNVLLSRLWPPFGCG